MPRQAKIEDPEMVPVQLNIKVPWKERERLTRIAKQRGMSLNKLVEGALSRLRESPQ